MLEKLTGVQPIKYQTSSRFSMIEFAITKSLTITGILFLLLGFFLRQ